MLHHHLYAHVMKHARYVSTQSQNELINIIGQTQILQSILTEVKEARFYTILADDVIIRSQEQMALCIRFLDKNQNIREEFLDFREHTWQGYR